MSARRIVVLSSQQVEMRVSFQAIRRAAQRAASLLGDEVRVEMCEADELAEIPDADLAVVATGSLYAEASLSAVTSYFHKGGHLLTIGCDPLSTPYYVRGSVLEIGHRNEIAWHALGVADTYASTGPIAHTELEDIHPGFNFLEQVGLPPLADTGSLDVRLASYPQPDEPQYARHGVREAELTVACRCRDAAGRPVAAPMIRINRHDGGAITCLNFDPIQPDYYSSAAGELLLGHILASSLREAWKIQVDSKYARYMQDEPAAISIDARRLAGDDGDRTRQIEVVLTRDDQPDQPPVLSETVEADPAGTEQTWSNLDLAEGRYRVLARFLLEDQCIDQQQTGFYVLSNKAAQQLAARAPGLRIDPSISPDYCVHEDTPFPMTGTTYMAPPNYRDCFGNLNLAIAVRHFSHLQAAGINIIRTGVWTTYGLIYEEKGGFREEALRSMDAYFLAAAQANLPVQFAPSAFVMNYWNREASMFHDPDLRDKTLQCFKQFAERYADWPGVQLDVINEPSYSPFKHGFLWQLARPIGDAHEKNAWIDWLKDRYANDIALLRDAWAVSQDEVPDFEHAELPESDEFLTNYDGPARYSHRTKLADFYAFADDSFARWMRDVRDIVRQAAPRMLVMLGRDETLRVPTQQRDAFEHNVDLVCWHQWHREGVVFNEYCLNRVRAMPCCGQEMGVLCYKDQRNDERLDQWDVRNQIERKLIYCLGNWIQWQSYSDPTMDVHVENKLGAIRADGTERPAMGVLRLLSWLEHRVADRLKHRQEADERLAIVVPTSLWFSSDTHLGYRATMQAIQATHLHLRQPAYCILENLLMPENASQIGQPDVIILPSATILSDDAWANLLRIVDEQGVTLLITGSIEQNEYWQRRSRLSSIGIECQSRKLATVERVRVGDNVYDCTFREALKLNMPAKVLLRSVPGQKTVPELTSVEHGQGRIVYCPIPVELADAIEPTVALYRQITGESQQLPPAPVRMDEANDSAAHFVYAIEYDHTTAVSIVNEGPADTIRFTLTRSEVDISIDVAAGRASKLYIDSDGELVAGYIHGRLQIGQTEIQPNGDLAFARTSVGWTCMRGQIDAPEFTLAGKMLNVGSFMHVRTT